MLFQHNEVVQELTIKSLQQQLNPVELLSKRDASPVIIHNISLKCFQIKKALKHFMFP